METPPPYRPTERRERNSSGVAFSVLGALAVVIILAVTLGAAGPSPFDPNAIEPAEGEAFREAPPAATNAPAPAPAPTATPAPTVPAPATPTTEVPPSPSPAAPQSYSTEEDCRKATNGPCHATECSSGEELAVCPTPSLKNWQAVVENPVNPTSVPEKIDPPIDQ